MPDTDGSQKLEYRGVRYVIAPQIDAARHWIIYPAGGPETGARQGKATAAGTGHASTFRPAVTAARQAIDEWLANGD